MNKTVEVAIAVQDLTKRYTNVLAVGHMNFKVHRGEFFGFLGPNGAGKTTTINMLTRVTKATSGKAFILNYDLATEPVKVKEHIGVVPGASNIYDEMTGWANIIFCAKLTACLKKKEKKSFQEKVG